MNTRQQILKSFMVGLSVGLNDISSKRPTPEWVQDSNFLTSVFEAGYSVGEDLDIFVDDVDTLLRSVGRGINFLASSLVECGNKK